MSGTNFELAPGVGALQLILPIELTRASRHVEISVELSVAGQVEAPAANNDVLDVPLLPRKLLLVELADEVGEPITSQAVELDFSGDISSLTTDDTGTVQVIEPPTSTALLRFPDEAALIQTLKSRWDSPRDGLLVKPGPSVRVALGKAPIGDLELVAGANRVSIEQVARRPYRYERRSGL